MDSPSVIPARLLTQGPLMLWGEQTEVGKDSSGVLLQ